LKNKVVRKGKIIYEKNIIKKKGRRKHIKRKIYEIDNNGTKERR
jgi:hypothetical protein